MVITDFESIQRGSPLIQLESDFVKCSDLLTVQDLNEATDRESFRIVHSHGKGVVGRYDYDIELPNETPRIIVRETVFEKLKKADADLKVQTGYEHCQLCVTYGYRSPKIQRLLWDDVYAKKRTELAGAPIDEIREAAHRSIAYPDVAGHPTGGAVDVIILNSVDETFLDFGTEISDFTRVEMYYHSDQISEEAKKNRKLLREIMCRQGFAPFDGEWWHFSYGDKEWAFYMFRKKLREEGIVTSKTALYSQKQKKELIVFD